MSRKAAGQQCAFNSFANKRVSITKDAHMEVRLLSTYSQDKEPGGLYLLYLAQTGYHILANFTAWLASHLSFHNAAKNKTETQTQITTRMT